MCVGLYEFKSAQQYVTLASDLMRLLCTRLDPDASCEPRGSGDGGGGEGRADVDAETEREPFFAPFFIERALCHYHQSEFEAAYANAFRALSLLRSLYSPRLPAPEPQSTSTSATLTGATNGSGSASGKRRAKTVFEMTERHPLHYLPPTSVLDVVRHASKICVVRRQFKDAALLVEYAVRYARYCSLLGTALLFFAPISTARSPTLVISFHSFDANDVLCRVLTECC